jgi:hypothetical protein
MGIDIAKPFPHQGVFFDVVHDFFMLRMHCHGESLQQRENLYPVFEIAAGKFPNDEGVTNNMALIQ